LLYSRCDCDTDSICSLIGPEPWFVSRKIETDCAQKWQPWAWLGKGFHDLPYKP